MLFFLNSILYVTFVKFAGSAHVIATGKTYNQIYIGRITLKEGKISCYREFWNLM